jgi:hypothetical protein
MKCAVDDLSVKAHIRAADVKGRSPDRNQAFADRD